VTSKKRLAGEARAAERDAALEAERNRRADAAHRRAVRRMKREAEQERLKQNLTATRKLRASLSSPNEDSP
jgi:hypothetical protein